MTVMTHAANDEYPMIRTASNPRLRIRVRHKRAPACDGLVHSGGLEIDGARVATASTPQHGQRTTPPVNDLPVKPVPPRRIFGAVHHVRFEHTFARRGISTKWKGDGHHAPTVPLPEL